jgi:hypothetical protein
MPGSVLLVLRQLDQQLEVFSTVAETGSPQAHRLQVEQQPIRLEMSRAHPRRQDSPSVWERMRV